MGRPPPSGRKRKAPGPGPGQAERQSKRRGKQGKPSKDVYEAEDEPDEFSNARRYDQVESYEYEPPSEIEEDEEIDEELAFTAEDKLKYGGWFSDGDGGSSDGGFDEGSEEAEEGEDVPERDSALDILCSDEELQGDEISDGSEDEGESEEGEDGTEGPSDEAPEEAGPQDSDDDLLQQLGGDDDAMDDDGEEDDEAEDDEKESLEASRHRNMLAAVLGGAEQGRSAKPGHVTQRLVSEAYPESEFGLNAGTASIGAGGELTLADLMAGLGGEGRKKLPATLRKQLERMAQGTKSQVVSAPLPRVIKERAERTAGYKLTKEEVSKWQPIVKANREAPTLRFTSARDEVPRISTTAAIVSQHTAETEMEAEVAALLEAAGAANAAAVTASEEALAAKALTVEEAKERQGRLAKLRALLFYHEMKAKRLKHIKSKEYHRKSAKSDKRRMERALLQGGDEEEAEAAERAEQEAAEFERAKERLTLKHRNTSRWARRALKRGATITDAGTKEAVAEQLRLGQALRRRIEGRTGDTDSQEDEDQGTESGSDGEAPADQVGAGTSGRGMSNRVKALALDILSGSAPGGEDEALPKKGLFALPFMARALERKRQLAMMEATATLNQLEGEATANGTANGSAPNAATGRRAFGGPAARAAATSDPSDSSDHPDTDSDTNEDREAKATRLGKILTDNLPTTTTITTTNAATPASQARAKSGKGTAKLRAPTADEEADLDRALANAGVGSSGAGGAGANGGDGVGVGKQQAGQRKGVTSGGGPVGKAQPAFIPAPFFLGGKVGMVFRKGPQGMGYYEDTRAPTNTLQPATPTPQPTTKTPRGKSADNTKAPAPAAIQAGRAKQAASAQHATAAHENGRAGKAGQGDYANGVHEEHDNGNGDVSSDDDVAVGNGDYEVSREGIVTSIKSKAAEQRALVNMAFASDDVAGDFAADKAQEVAAELPHIEEPSLLPGWGAWADQQKDPKWMRDAKAKAQKERDKAAASRADAKLQHVILSEKYDRKAMSRYTTEQVPFPFDSRETYERSMRQPLGRQYNPDASFRDLTRPAILKNTGVVIDPIRFSKPVAKYASEVAQKSDKVKVLTVAGGTVQKAKGIKKRK